MRPNLKLVLERFARRFLGISEKEAPDSEIANELRAYLLALVAQNRAQGMTLQEARKAALRECGSAGDTRQNSQFCQIAEVTTDPASAQRPVQAELVERHI